ncbi:MAG: NAD-dependent epimerase/dehydratase family protein [Microgenomates group bacterium]|nr:NAD-dependent epimerase/dehydratase family protein [Microgenomates group bacterium]
MRVIILGGTGFIGSYLAKSLLSLNYEVVVTGTNSSSFYNNLILKNHIKSIKFEIINLYEKYTLKKIVKENDIVFNLISPSTPQKSSCFPIDEIKNHFLPQIQLIEFLFKLNIKKMIFFSSGGGIYYDNQETPYKENSLLLPHSPHAIIKLSIEHYLNFFSKYYLIPILIYRISNPYGPNQNIKEGFGLIPHLIKSVKENKSPVLYNHGKIIRDFIYIEDLIEAITISFNKKNNHAIYNLGSGKGTSIKTVWKIIKKISKSKLEPIYKEKRIIDPPKVILDITRFSQEYNWKPKTPIEKGLRITYESSLT